jgi:hypothetical protein
MPVIERLENVGASLEIAGEICTVPQQSPSRSKRPIAPLFFSQHLAFLAPFAKYHTALPESENLSRKSTWHESGARPQKMI